MIIGKSGKCPYMPGFLGSPLAAPVLGHTLEPVTGDLAAAGNLVVAPVDLLQFARAVPAVLNAELSGETLSRFSGVLLGNTS